MPIETGQVPTEDIQEITQAEVDALKERLGIANFININPVPTTQGGYVAGQPATDVAGLNLNDAFNKLLYPATQPTASLNINAVILEKGSDYSQIITISFEQNDAGLPVSYSLQEDNIEISNLQQTNYNKLNILSSLSLQAFVNYDSSDKLPSGTINTSQITITPRLNVWYGSVDSIPSDSSNVRSINNNVWDNQNTITLDTGTTLNTFVVAVPTSKTNAPSLSAQDITNNVSLVYTFNSSIDVILPNSDLEEYRIYVLQTDNPYPSNAQHLIQI